ERVMTSLLPNEGSTLPEDLVTRLHEALGEERAHVVLEHLARRPAPCFRVNRLRVLDEDSVLEQVRAIGITPSPLAGADGVYVIDREQRETLTHSPLVDDG